jgi:hypothetical protein
MGDLVPTVPYSPNTFQHISPEYVITAKNSISPTIDEIIIREASEGSELMTGASMSDTGEAHESYFNRINACYRVGFSIPFKRASSEDF